MAKPISIKVSEKGAVSIYGLQRFPVTLYAEQWEALLAKAPSILSFIEANRPRLATKSEGGVTKGTTAL